MPKRRPARRESASEASDNKKSAARAGVFASIPVALILSLRRRLRPLDGRGYRGRGGVGQAGLEGAFSGGGASCLR